MSRTNVSKAALGDVRFGDKPHGIDTSVKEWKMSPQQLEEYNRTRKDTNKPDKPILVYSHINKKKKKEEAKVKDPEKIVENKTEEYENVLAELKKKISKSTLECDLLKKENETMAKEAYHEILSLENEIQKLEKENGILKELVKLWA